MSMMPCIPYLIVTIHTIQTIYTVISNIPCPTDLHTIPIIHTIPTTHAIHTIPTIYTKHTILSKHTIPDRPYTPYIPNIPYHTPTTRGRGVGTLDYPYIYKVMLFSSLLSTLLSPIFSWWLSQWFFCNPEKEWKKPTYHCFRIGFYLKFNLVSGCYTLLFRCAKFQPQMTDNCREDSGALNIWGTSKCWSPVERFRATL